jgi:putative flippase GtrA
MPTKPGSGPDAAITGNGLPLFESGYRVRSVFLSLISNAVLRFLLVGGLAAGVDIALFSFLLWGSSEAILELTALEAKATSMSVAVVLAFFGHDFFSFSGKKKYRFRNRFGLFILAYGAMSIFQMVGFFFALLVMGNGFWDKVLANVLVIGLSTLIRFFLAKKHIFQRPSI